MASSLSGLGPSKMIYLCTSPLQNRLNSAIAQKNIPLCQTIFLQMKGEYTSPSGESFGQYLQAYQESRPQDNVLDHYIHILRKVIQVGDVYVLTLVESGNFWKLESYVTKMFQEGIFLKAETSGRVLSALIGVEKEDTAISLQGQMQQMGWFPDPPPPYEEIIMAQINQDSFSTDTLICLIENRLAPSMTTIERAIFHCLEKELVKNALKIYQSLGSEVEFSKAMITELFKQVAAKLKR